MKKRWIVVLICWGLLVCTVAAASALSFPAEATLRVNCHVRSGPSADTQSLTILPLHTQVTLTGQSGVWFQVTANGITGYIRSDLLILSENETPIVSPSPTPYATVQPTTVPSLRVTLRLGMKGDAVRILQEELSRLGYLVGAQDGVFGTATHHAVIAFQRSRVLTADGVAGPRTFDAIDRALSNVVQPTSTATAQPTATVAPITITRTLKLGLYGEDVQTLRARLVALGYMTTTGEVFDAVTVSAIKEFQSRNRLTVDGMAGPVTQAMLFSSSAVGVNATVTPQPIPSLAPGNYATLSSGSKSAAVRTLQQALATLGYYTEGVDGDFGSGTQMAVKRFQQVHGLAETGVADSTTQTTLYSGSAIKAPAPTPFVPQYPGTGILSNPPTASQVRYGNWTTDIKYAYKAGQQATVYDFQANLGYHVYFKGMGEHAESEPLTAADTEVLFRTFNLKNTWTPRPVWVVMPDGKVYMASIHNMPHLTGDIKNNNFDGHLCIHFPKDMAEAAKIGTYAVTHQNTIRSGWQMTEAMK